MKNIKYIVGIDFGHGETTANYIEIIDKEEKKYSEPKQLSIKTGSEGKKIRSFFCRYRTSEAESWTYDLDPKDKRISNYIIKMLSGEWQVQFNHSFKVPINSDPYLEKVFGQFVNCVYKNIVEFNGMDSQVGLIVNENLEPQNFLLYAACPSGWSNEQRESFKFFLINNGVPCKSVFKESDAAWISYIPQKIDNLDNPKLLVIDYGSSTIDLTWSEDTQKDIFNPNTLGASKVENLVFNYLVDNDEIAKEEYQKVLDLLQDDFFVKEIIKLGIREEKENFYSEILEYPDDNDIEFRGYLLSKIFAKIKGLTRFGDELPLIQVNQILDPYIQEVREYFLKFRKDHMEKSGIYNMPKRIILTGGASRMNFVKALVKEVFEIEPVIDEAKASESISSGIALAGAKEYLLNDEIIISNPFGNPKEIELLIKQYVNEELQNQIYTLLNNIFDNWQQGKISLDVKNNLNKELLDIAKEKSESEDKGQNGLDPWFWVMDNINGGYSFVSGNKSLHALFVEIISTINKMSSESWLSLSDAITQKISDHYQNIVKVRIVPLLHEYVKIYSPMTTERDINNLISLRLNRINFSIKISPQSLRLFLALLVKTSYQNVWDKDSGGVWHHTLNKDRDSSYRNGYFNDLRQDFESFCKTIEADIPDINIIAGSIYSSVVAKVEEIRKYCTCIKI